MSEIVTSVPLPFDTGDDLAAALDLPGRGGLRRRFARCTGMRRRVRRGMRLGRRVVMRRVLMRRVPVPVPVPGGGNGEPGVMMLVGVAVLALMTVLGGVVMAMLGGVVVAMLGGVVMAVLGVRVATGVGVGRRRRVRRNAIPRMVVMPEVLVQRAVQVRSELEPEHPQQTHQRRAESAASGLARSSRTTPFWLLGACHGGNRIVPRLERKPHDPGTSTDAERIDAVVDAPNKVIGRARWPVPHAMARGTHFGALVLLGIVGAAAWPTVAFAAPEAEADAGPPSQPAPHEPDTVEIGPATPEDGASPKRRRRRRAGQREVREVRVKPAARRADGLTASGRTIDASAIKNTPKRSAEDLLRLVPGMLIVQHGNQGKGHQFYVRGFDAAHGSDVELTVDDIPLNEASNVHAHGYLDLAQIPADGVSGIDVTKGSYRLSQGNFATAGSIGYRLGVPRADRGTRILYEAGTTNRHRAAVIHAPRGMSESTFVALEAMHDQGRYGPNRVSQRLSGTGKVRLFERGGFHIDGLATAYAARFGLPGTLRLDDVNAGRADFYDAYPGDTRGESSRAIVGLSSGVQTDKHALDLGVYGKARRLSLDENFTGFLQFPEQGDRHHQLQEAGTVGTRAHWSFAAHSRLKLLLHGNWQGNLIEQREDRLTLDGRPWDVSRDLSIRSNTWGLAPGVRALPTSWLMVEGGVRLDLFHYDVTDRVQGGQRFTDTFFAASPRIATQVTLGPRFKLFGAYGRGLRSPEARAITLPEGPQENVDLDVFAGGRAAMTTTDSTEVGARFTPGTLFDVGMAAFGTWIGRESIFDHVSGFNVELGATRRLGLEADVQLHPTDWLDLGADVTAVYGRFTETNAPIPGAPPLIISTFGTLDHPSGWHTGWRWFLLGPRPLTYGATAGVSTVLDASVGYRHRKWFSIDLSLDNILGSKWREGEYNFASHWDPNAQRSQIPTIHYIAGYPIGARLTLTGWF